MKKIFMAVILFVVVVSKVSIAQAVTHSSQENFNYCFQMCISALNATEDYADLIVKGKYEIAIIRRQECDNLQKSLEFLWHNGSVRGAESLDLMLTSIIILQERYLTLDYFISALDAGVAGNMTLYEEYKQKMLETLESSFKLRQEFRAKYGY